MRKFLMTCAALCLVLGNARLGIAAVKEKVTLDVSGVECERCSNTLNTALDRNGIHANITPTQGKSHVRVMAEIDPATDLGPAGKAVAAASTPHKTKSPPALALVMFAKLDRDSVIKVNDALGKVKGVDAKHSKANVKRGEINVRIVGGSDKEKVTASGIREALELVGIKAAFRKATVTSQTAKKS